jgi:hypothetical protein
MAMYNNTATIINNSQYALELDTANSTGLSEGNWPAVINNDGIAVQATEIGYLNMLFSVAYKISGISVDAWIVFNFYNASFGPYQWHMSLLPAGDGGISGVSGSIQIDYKDVYATSESPLYLSHHGFSGNSKTSETYVIDGITLAS